MTACLSLFSQHRKTPRFDRELTSNGKWVLYDTLKRARHWLSQQDPVPHTRRPPLTPRKIILCICCTRRQVVHYELLLPGQTMTADLYSQQLERVQQILQQNAPALVNRKGSLPTMPGCMWHGWPEIPYSDLTGRYCVIHLPYRILRQHIIASLILWTTTFMVSPSPMR